MSFFLKLFVGIVLKYLLIFFYIFSTDILLDGIPSPSRVRRRLPTDAHRDDSTGRRCSSAHGKHMHFPSLHPALLQQSRATPQASHGDKNEKLWICLKIKTVLNDIFEGSGLRLFFYNWLDFEKAWKYFYIKTKRIFQRNSNACDSFW